MRAAGEGRMNNPWDKKDPRWRRWLYVVLFIVILALFGWYLE